MGDKIHLRAFTSEDIKFTLEWHNKPEIKKMYSGHPFPVKTNIKRKKYCILNGLNS